MCAVLPTVEEPEPGGSMAGVAVADLIFIVLIIGVFVILTVVLRGWNGYERGEHRRSGAGRRDRAHALGPVGFASGGEAW
jgi:uncharacterized membrane protein